MREVFTMWRDTRMITLVAVTAAVYAAALVPFKPLTIIPGATSVRPGNVFPVVFSLLFGPAAAWGAALGNLVGDVVAGTLGERSLFGVVGNFFFGLVGYKIWGNLGSLSSGVRPNFRTDVGAQLLEYIVVSAVAAAVSAAIIAWGLEVLGLFPFSVLGTILIINNLLPAVVLGPPLLFILYPRVEDLGLLYTDVMRQEDLSSVDHTRQEAVAYGLTAVSLMWIAAGIAISVGVQGVAFGAAPNADIESGSVPPSTIQVAFGTLAFLAILALSALSGERLSDLVESDADRSTSPDDGL